jgi:anti-sigma factor RsiW
MIAVMDELGIEHRIEDDLAEGWVEQWAVAGVEAIEEYLAKHLAFLAYLDQVASPARRRKGRALLAAEPERALHALRHSAHRHRLRLALSKASSDDITPNRCARPRSSSMLILTS